MWCTAVDIAAPAAVEAAARRPDSIAWSPAAVLVPEWLIEAYVIADIDSAIVASISHAAGHCDATGQCGKHDYRQSAHRTLLH
jgi:hypothetical protein